MRLWFQLPFLPEKTCIYVKYLNKSSLKKNCSVKKEEREDVEEEGKDNKEEEKRRKRQRRRMRKKNKQ